MGKKNKRQRITGELPERFLARLADMYGQSIFLQLKKSFVERPTTFRINRIKALKHENIKALLEEKGFRSKRVSWYEDAFLLQNKSKRELTSVSDYVEGKLYVQSLASMVPPLVLDPKPGERVLDLTAAPGSKTSQIAAMMEKQGELVANDNNKVRFFKLKHNMELLGVFDDTGFLTLRMEDGSRLCGEYPAYFDKILFDAPCSAEARFIEGEPKTYGYWSERKIKEMAYKQRKLLLSAWTALKPGGILVYSTCTFAPEENEMQISRLIERFSGEVEVLSITIPGLKTLEPLRSWKGKAFHPEVKKAVRIFPTGEIEGFFVAKLKKRNKTEETRYKIQESK